MSLRATSTVHVLGEDLFRALLVRERLRTSRHNQAVALMTVTVDPQVASVPVMNTVALTLSAVARSTDIVGWYGASTIGVILHGYRAERLKAGNDLRTRVRNRLADGLGEPMLERLSINVWPEGILGTARAARDFFSVAKRAVDLLGSLALLMCLAPLFLLIACLVKLTSEGPVLFRQERVGHLMQPFTMLKFRTMFMGSDHAIHQEYVTRFIQSEERAGDTELAPFKLVDDPRVTPLGRMLRKTSLDELPQIWNVLVGDMSLVGPRPPVSYEVEQYKPWHLRRLLEAKPGLTGPWQVGGRSRTTFDDMVRLDLRYARTRSLSADLKILFATPAAVIAGKGAC